MCFGMQWQIWVVTLQSSGFGLQIVLLGIGLPCVAVGSVFDPQIWSPKEPTDADDARLHCATFVGQKWDPFLTHKTGPRQTPLMLMMCGPTVQLLWVTNSEDI